MIGKENLVFNTGSMGAGDSDNIGAYLRDSAGTLITGQTIGGSRYLDVAAATLDGSGTAITSTLVSGKQGLDVNVISNIAVDLNGIYNVSTNPTPDNVGIIAFSRAATPGLSDEIQTPTAAAASLDAVVAANVHGLDVNAFNMGYNGTTWDRIKSTSGAMNVNISSQTGSSPLLVDDTANTTIGNSAVVVGTTEAALLGSQQAGRKYLYVQNLDNKAIYIGTTGVTTANGIRMSPGTVSELRIGAALSLHAIASQAGADVRIMQLS